VLAGPIFTSSERASDAPCLPPDACAIILGAGWPRPTSAGLYSLRTTTPGRASARVRVEDELSPWRSAVSEGREFLLGGPSEAYLSTEAEKACPDARLPYAHANAIGAQHHSQSSQKGARSARGRTLQIGRFVQSLRRKTDIKRALQEGRRFHSPQAVLHARRRGGEDGAAVGIRLTVVAGRRFANAVSRNRARRIVREAGRELLRDQEGPWDLLLVARPNALEQPSSDRRQTLAELFRQAGVLPDRCGAAA
jgi:ribonuclease P protein component